MGRRSLLPVPLVGALALTRVCSHLRHRTDATWCWGDNAYGQLGRGDTNDRTAPAQVGTENTWAAISSGEVHVCATRPDRSSWCWGDNEYGQLGLGDTINRTSPARLPGVTTRAVFIGGLSTATYFIG